MNIEAVLSKTDLFADANPAVIKSVAKHGRCRRFKKTEHLFFDEDIGTALYILLSGSVRLYKSSSDGKEVTVKLVNPGEMFAEVVLSMKIIVESMADLRADLFFVCS